MIGVNHIDTRNVVVIEDKLSYIVLIEELTYQTLMINFTIIKNDIFVTKQVVEKVNDYVWVLKLRDMTIVEPGPPNIILNFVLVLWHWIIILIPISNTYS